MTVPKKEGKDEKPEALAAQEIAIVQCLCFVVATHALVSYNGKGMDKNQVLTDAEDMAVRMTRHIKKIFEGA